MFSRRGLSPRVRYLDTKPSNSPRPVTDSDAGPETAEAPALLPDAEAGEQVARAESLAKVARARAVRLRRQAETAAGERPDATDNTDAEDSDTIAVENGTDEAEPPLARSRRRWVRVRRPGRKAVGIGAAFVLVSASLGTAGFIAWQHLTLIHERQRAAEFTAAARHGVETLMSIDPDHAKENLQRTIDDSTGQLKSQLEATATYLVKNAQDAKISAKVTVEDIAVESMTDSSATVLVVAKSDTTGPDKTGRPPAVWRLSVDISRDGSQLKMSKIEFVQ
jgi:Mce-associated membrane protein